MKKFYTKQINKGGRRSGGRWWCGGRRIYSSLSLFFFFLFCILCVMCKTKQIGKKKANAARKCWPFSIFPMPLVTC